MWELLSAIERAEHEQYIKKQAEALAVSQPKLRARELF
jgi:hypothetical protein